MELGQQVVIARNLGLHPQHVAVMRKLEIDGCAEPAEGDAEKVKFTGKKWEQKKHFRSSNRPGGITATPMSKLRTENPGEILRHAVKYMLPKNRTQTARMKRLIIVK